MKRFLVLFVLIFSANLAMAVDLSRPLDVGITLSAPSITVNASWNCVKLANGATTSTIDYTTLTLTSNVPIEWVDIDCSSQCYVGFNTTASASIQRTAGLLGKERVYSNVPATSVTLYLETLITTASYFISYPDRK